MGGTIKLPLPHFPENKKQTVVRLLIHFCWIHSHSDYEWNAFEIIGENKNNYLCPYCSDIMKAQGITRHAQQC